MISTFHDNVFLVLNNRMYKWYSTIAYKLFITERSNDNKLFEAVLFSNQSSFVTDWCSSCTKYSWFVEKKKKKMQLSEISTVFFYLCKTVVSVFVHNFNYLCIENQA